MGFDVGVFQALTQRKKFRLSVQRHGGTERRVISQNGNQKRSLSAIHCAWNLSVDGGKQEEVSKPESGRSGCRMDKG